MISTADGYSSAEQRIDFSDAFRTFDLIRNRN